MSPLKILRWGIGGILLIVSQFAQWACLVVAFAALIVGFASACEGNWQTVGVALLATILWAVGALAAGFVNMWSAHLLP